MKLHNSTNCQSEVFFALCKSVNSPLSLGAWLRYKYSHKEYLDMSINPLDYQDAASFSKDYAIVEYLSKSKDLAVDVDLEAEALRRFTTAESNCLAVNRSFRDPDFWAKNPTLAMIFHHAQRKIVKILGRLDPLKLFESCEWGPGATFELKRKYAQVDRKVCELPITVSNRSLGYARSVIECDLHWSHVILGIRPEGSFCLLPSVFQVTDRNRITTVPKSAKTDRTIAIEPRMNTYLQKGVGMYIRRRLSKWGQNLDDQGRNQKLAADAARLRYATIDLSMASDSVANELVAHLLPVDWWSFLYDLRCPYGEKPDGSVLRYEKFSSMGNGFTFELETLIFYALAASVASVNIDDAFRREVVSVYGDDIIVPTEISGQLISILKLCGFDVNQKKTFTDGLFYESCGRHYFDSVEVTPVYQKEPLHVPIEAMRAGNRLLRLGSRIGFQTVKSPWMCLRRHFAGSLSFQTPFGCEDEGSWQVPHSWLRNERKNVNHGIQCRVLSASSKTLPGHSEALYATRLRQLSQGKDWSDFGVTLRHLPWQAQRDRSSTLTPKGSYVWDRSDDVVIPIKNHYMATYRWVIPSGEFAFTFDK